MAVEGASCGPRAPPKSGRQDYQSHQQRTNYRSRQRQAVRRTRGRLHDLINSRPISGSGVTIVTTGTSIEVRGSAVTSGDTLGDGVTFSIYRSIVSVPTQTTAPSGGDVAVYVSVNSVTVAALVEGVGFDFVDTGLVIGKTYYYYSTVSAITGGNATLKGTNTGKNQSTLIAENTA